MTKKKNKKLKFGRIISEIFKHSFSLTENCKISNCELVSRF